MKCTAKTVKPSNDKASKSLPHTIATAQGEANPSMAEEKIVGLTPSELKITVRKQVRQELKDSEHRYRRLFESAQDGILILDAGTGQITDVNPFLVTMLGYSPKEFVKKKIWEVGAFKDIKASMNAFGALQKKKYIRYENLPLKTKGGQLIQVEFVSNVYKVDGKKVIQCNIRDITDRKRAEEALQKTYQELEARVLERTDELRKANEALKTVQMRLETLIHTNPAVIYAAKPVGDYGVIFIGKNIKAQMGYEDREFLEDSGFWASHIHPGDQEKTLAQLSDLFEHDSYIHEYRFLHKNGTYRWIHDQSKLVRDEKGNPVEIIGFWTDITERKHAEEALRESEEKYRLVVENANDAIIVVQDGMFQFVNSRAAEITGYSEEELIAKPFSEIIHPEDREIVLERHLKGLKGENLLRLNTYRIVGRGGQIIWVEVNTVLFSWQGLLATLNFIRDITARKMIEARLQEALKLEAWGIFSSGLAHELRNPLTVINSCTQLCLRENGLKASMKEKLQMIRRNSQRAAKIIQDLLNLAMTSGLTLSPVDLNKVVLKMWTLVKPNGPNSKISFVPKLNHQLPKIKGDKEKLERVFNNLLLNAIQAISNQGNIIVETKLFTFPNFIEVIISDDGSGIAKKDLENIFNPFYSTKKEGMGLGLSICQRIIHQHKGSITVNSERGHGARFSVRLPVDLDENEQVV